MKPTKLLITLSALLFGFTALAQDKELGIFLGTAQYQGDLSQAQLTINETKPAFGILGRYYINPRFDIKANLSMGWIGGSDANYASVSHDRYERNLSFQSVVVDLGGTAEFNILPYISNSKKYRFAPVLFAGLSVFYFNPTAVLNGTTYALQPLSTEGEGLPGGPAKYSLVQVSIPLGIAFKYSLGNFWNLGLEIALHKTFTDYLDDVSGTYYDYNKLVNAKGSIAGELAVRKGEVDKGFDPTEANGVKRGNPSLNDTYIFAGFTLTKTIRRFSCTGF